MKDRIQKIILNEGLTPSRLADIMQVQRSSVSHILAGRNKPSMDFLTKLLHSFPAINGHWLLTGLGDMYSSGMQAFDAKDVMEPTTPSPDLFPSADNSIRETKPKLDVNKDITAQKSIETTAPHANTPKKTIKRIIVIYDDYSTEEIFNG